MRRTRLYFIFLPINCSFICGRKCIAHLKVPPRLQQHQPLLLLRTLQRLVGFRVDGPRARHTVGVTHRQLKPRKANPHLCKPAHYRSSTCANQRTTGHPPVQTSALRVSHLCKPAHYTHHNWIAHTIRVVLIISSFQLSCNFNVQMLLPIYDVFVFMSFYLHAIIVVLFYFFVFCFLSVLVLLYFVTCA